MAEPATEDYRHVDAEQLRLAADILLARAKRMTFALRVVIRFLERTASKLDHPSG